ncbi:hypothetical protein [uncultured Enterococcus sp.]|uniref:hypothetical protein n=1 Tax=uncultured Enterococcus sp. TaxID=167972 RepID=UPI0025CCCD67|nr:hypothetical protein [uncultured Enterococcus sp.]
MKKKQLAKLKKQFRPSFEGARKQLFDAMIEKAAALYQLNIRVFIDPKQPNDMMIELLDPTERDQQIKVPLDDNFKTVVKRIQNEEKGLLDRFSENLVEEIASYWSPDAARKQVSTPEKKATPAKAETTSAKVTDDKSTDAAAFATFSEKISAFPKFAVKETAQQIEVVEKTAKEERLLATISKTEENSFTIETALERKYKLKLDVIPVIEAFAKTPLANR